MKLRARQVFRIILFGLFMLGALYVAAVLSILRPWETGGNFSAARQEAETLLAASPGPRSHTGDIVSLRLGGSPYARGYVHGRMLAPAIREMDSVLAQLMDAKSFHVPMLGKALAVRKARWLEAKIPPEYIAEMHGVADGSGVPYADILLFNVFDDLLYVHGCSSLGLEKGPAAGQWIHARNLDYLLPHLARFKTVLVYDSPGRRYLSVGFPGYIGVLTGFNDRGISLSAHTSISADNAVGIPLRLPLPEDHGGSGHPRPGRRHPAGGSADHRQQPAAGLLRREPLRRRRGDRPPMRDPRARRRRDHGDQPLPVRRAGRAAARTGAGSSRAAGSAPILCRNSNPAWGGRPAVADVQRWFASPKGQGAVFPSVANKGTVQGVIFAPAEGAFYVAKGNKTPVTTAGYLRLALPFPLQQ